MVGEAKNMLLEAEMAGNTDYPFLPERDLDYEAWAASVDDEREQEMLTDVNNDSS